MGGLARFWRSVRIVLELVWNRGNWGLETAELGFAAGLIGSVGAGKGLLGGVVFKNVERLVIFVAFAVDVLFEAVEGILIFGDLGRRVARALESADHFFFLLGKLNRGRTLSGEAMKELLEIITKWLAAGDIIDEIIWGASSKGENLETVFVADGMKDGVVIMAATTDIRR